MQSIQIEVEDPKQKPPGRPLFALGFRPFFLAAGISAVVLMLGLVVAQATNIWHYNYFDMMVWHGHEMLFGFAAAVIAGFLLTAVRNWTGLETATGSKLKWLVILWICGRLAPAIPGLPLVLVASIDLAFLPALAAVLSQPLLKAGQVRNYFVLPVLILLTFANGLVHAEVLGFSMDTAQVGLYLAVYIVVLLIAIVSGRVMPFFTERAITGFTASRWPWLEALSYAGIGVFAIADLLLPDAPATAWIALAVALIHAVRLYSWGCWKAWKNPMLSVLYLAYAWLVAGFVLYALSAVGFIAKAQALHAFTAGAIGMFTLGMMARVALGHTGRPILASKAIVAAFGLVFFAAVLRIFSDEDVAEGFAAASGLIWSMAFLIFAVVYIPILIRPRADGRPG